MTIPDLLKDLRERQIEIFERDGALCVTPASRLSPEETQFISSNAVELIAALRVPESKPDADTLVVEPAAVSLIDALVQNHGLEVRLERMTALPNQHRYSLFPTRRGLLHLEELNEQEARHYAAKGQLSVEEVREWWSWRQDRARWPKESRYRALLLKARRAGFNHVAFMTNGQVRLW